MFTVIYSSLKISATLTLVLLATVAGAAESAYKPNQTHAVKALQQGEKWATDAVVRQGMDQIRQALAASQAAIDQSQLGSRDYHQLAQVVDNNVATMVKNCKLNREADAAFHNVVLVDLRWSSQLMLTSPKPEAQRAGALGVQQALRNYGEYFQHPGWRMGTTP